MTYSAMTYYGKWWLNTMLMAGAIDCESIYACMAAARKSSEWAPNLCISIVVPTGHDSYMQPGFNAVHEMQHGEKKEALERLFAHKSMQSRDATYWNLRRKLMDAVENVAECIEEVDKALDASKPIAT